jgi:hypothetical protein
MPNFPAIPLLRIKKAHILDPGKLLDRVLAYLDRIYRWF